MVAENEISIQNKKKRKSRKAKYEEYPQNSPAADFGGNIMGGAQSQRFNDPNARERFQSQQVEQT